MFVSTQANRDAADLFSPPKPENVAFGDALLRASDIALSMCMVESSDYRRLIQYQKYRDGELNLRHSVLVWNVDSGNIYEDAVQEDEF